jgi:hypothetical protein
MAIKFYPLEDPGQLGYYLCDTCAEQSNLTTEPMPTNAKYCDD